MSKNLLFFISLLPLLLSCNNEKQAGSSEGTDTTIDNSCILSHADQPCSLLSAELVSKYVKLNEVRVKQKEYISRTKKPEMNNCHYSWQGAEMDTSMMKVPGTDKVQEFIAPVEYKIALTNIKTMAQKDPMAYFKKAYGGLSGEEKAEMKNEIEEKLQENQKGGDISSKIIDETKVVSVNGIGDAAFWENDISALRVLVNDIMFQLTVYQSKNQEENLSMAKKMAQDIIDQCQ